jgi:hypothetical protein
MMSTAHASSEDEWVDSDWDDVTLAPATGGPTSNVAPPSKSAEMGKRKRSDSDDDEELINALARRRCQARQKDQGKSHHHLCVYPRYLFANPVRYPPAMYCCYHLLT